MKGYVVNSTLYQDTYNKRKTWLVCHMNGAKYLKQFIDGVQCGNGVRTTVKRLREIGILNFNVIG